MNHEIHIFLGSACITKESIQNYPVGERHAFLFFMRVDADSEYNVAKAKKIVRDLGLNKIEFTKVGRLDPDRVTDRNQELYSSAMDSGSAIVLYSDPI